MIVSAILELPRRARNAKLHGQARRGAECVSPPPVPAPAPAVAANGEDEVDLLQSAMGAAQSGRSADALAAVDNHVRAFPKSALAQEREAIAIEALVNLGRMPEAKARIERFRAAWPTSTHLLRLESLIH